MRKTPEMRRREAKRKKRLEWEKLYREFYDSYALVAVRAGKAGAKLKEWVKAIQKAKEQLTKAMRQPARKV